MYGKQVRLSIGRDFLTFEPYTVKFSDLPNLLCASNVLYSPTQYKDNTRKRANFLGFSDFLIFDYDEGLPDEQRAFFDEYCGFLVPTKSHMKEKNGVICERYRVILLLETPIELNYVEYKRLYKHMMKDLKLSSDTSCVDACRFYFSAPQPVTNCIRLKGTKCFSWQKFNYPDFHVAPLDPGASSLIDISKYKDLDVSYFETLEHSKRYPCPLCRLEGLDQKGHHLGFNKDDGYPTCFYDEEHSKILRKIYKQYKYGEIEHNIEDINDMVRAKCTPDLIKVEKNDPKPTNYSPEVHKMYDKALDLLEQEDEIGLDIETFSEYYVAETYEEANERLSADYKYIKGVYNSKCAEFKGVALDPFKNKIRIIGLSCDKTRVPFDMYWVTEKQKQRILNIIRDKLIVGQHLQFDIKSIMATYGKQYCPQHCFDIMIASRMIHMAQDPEDQQCGHNLEAVAVRYLNYKMHKEIEHTWGNDNLTPRQFEYATDDIAVLLPAYREQARQFCELYGEFNYKDYPREELEFLGPLLKYHPILALEMQTLLAVINIEFNGVKPNIPMMERKIDEYNRLIDENDAELGINCGSSVQCVAFLQKYVNPAITSSASGVLYQYENDPRVLKIIDGKMSRTRRGLMQSMCSTNLHPWDNRIHAKFNQLLNTGRFSCSEPNMQQIPKDIKNDVYMSADDDLETGQKGTVIYDTDYAAVELRLVTGVTLDPVLLEAYRKNTDMHYLTASLLFGKQIPTTHEQKEDAEKNPNTIYVNKWQRGFGKHMNFSLIYGQHWTTFVATVMANKQINMTETQAKEYYDKFFAIYKGLDAMIKNAQNTFIRGRDIEVTRWVRYPNGSIHKVQRKTAFFTVVQTLIGRRLAVNTERKMMNFPVQGSGADCLKLALCKIEYERHLMNSTQKTINIVHDDTVAESELVDFDANSKMFRGALEWAVNFVLKKLFYTPVDQDFCVISLLVEEIFLEGAFTLDDIDKKIVELIQEKADKAQKLPLEENEERVKLITECERLHKLLLKFRDRVNALSITRDTQMNSDKTSD